MLHTIDRVQYVEAIQRYCFFEFMEIKHVQRLIGTDGKLLPLNQLWIELQTMISHVEWKKIKFLLENRNVINILIFYERDQELYIKIGINPYTNKSSVELWSFNELQNWFRRMNNIDGERHSKGLGSVRQLNEDHYVTGLLQHLYNDEAFQDDNGLELTKKLLAGDPTKGFDLDLFQYIPSTKEFVIYEFLKRESEWIHNIQAHPMRYCWTGKANDNKQKFISLWSVKEHLNARLFLVNYSDNSAEKISLIEVLELDPNQGIKAENKYCMSRNVFQSWLHDMQDYNSNDIDYLSDFKCVHYDANFFNQFSQKKSKYGAEFSNIAPLHG